MPVWQLVAPGPFEQMRLLARAARAPGMATKQARGARAQVRDGPAQITPRRRTTAELS